MRQVQIIYSSQCPFSHVIDTIITGEDERGFYCNSANFGITSRVGVLRLEFDFEYPCRIRRIVTSPRTFNLYQRMRNRIRRWL